MKITKLSEYTEFVENLSSEYSLSRGQDGDYPLLPSGLRLDDHGNRKYPKRAVTSFLKQFKINAHQYMANPWDMQNDNEWMLMAQHFGLPTKLLDFTTSHITSLLFAVEKAFQQKDEQDAVVYFLNPFELNRLHIDDPKIINISEKDMAADEVTGPCIIQGRKINPRVNAQKGLFVLFQDNDIALEELVDSSVLEKVTIQGSAAKDILSALYSMGIGFTHIYPELTSVARDIMLMQDIEDFSREKD